MFLIGAFYRQTDRQTDKEFRSFDYNSVCRETGSVGFDYNFIFRERERETETETERHRERQRQRQTDRQTDRQRGGMLNLRTFLSFF